MNLFTVIIFSSILVFYSHGEENSNDFFTYSSLSISTAKLSPYQWRYIRVELPPWFSSMTIALDSDTDIDQKDQYKSPRRVPIMCFRHGGPPLPDVSDDALNRLELSFHRITGRFGRIERDEYEGKAYNPTRFLSDFFNGSAGGIPYLKNVEQCYPLHNNMALTLTYEQIIQGVIYFGVFNGIGLIRTQSKMINRGSAYHFTANVTVEACKTLWGQYCNQTVEECLCAQSNSSQSQQNNQEARVNNRIGGNLVACKNSSGSSCHGITDPKLYSLEVLERAESLIIEAKNIRFNPALINNTSNGSGISLMCYARYDVIAKKTLHDYSGDISKAPLFIQAPRAGTWYFTIEPVYQSNVFGRSKVKHTKICYWMEWQVLQCPQGKAGLNCNWDAYKLKAVHRNNPTTPYVYIPPDHNDLSLEAPNFPLEPLLSNSSHGNKSEVAWTYFIIDVPIGQAGRNIDIQLISDTKINYQLYTRFGGFPSLDSWDYRYTNQTGSGNDSSMFKLYSSSEEHINFYIFYAREGNWIIGLRHPISSGWQTNMSVSIKTCAYQCCYHGRCQSLPDASGQAQYGYCTCDETHGGFDCSVELVSQNEQRLQSAFLIASNAAAILPAFWALRQKAFAEWVIFMCSGIASGIYHACDVGTWCALKFQVLQFMDFWLSFVAVVSTFVYLTFISEAAKRTIHAIVFILTALMAMTGPTRASNVVLVIAMGSAGLLVGWLIEFCITHKSISFPQEPHLNTLKRWKDIRTWPPKLLKTLHNRFQWGFMLLGLLAVSLAAASWSLETSENYWLCHSAWHITIYSSAFFFLRSTAAILDSEYQVVVDTRQVVTQQDSSP